MLARESFRIEKNDHSENCKDPVESLVKCGWIGHTFASWEGARFDSPGFLVSCGLPVKAPIRMRTGTGG